MILLVKSGGEAAVPDWQAHFAELAPHLDVRWWDDKTVDPAEVAYVIVWEPAAGRLAGYPNLRLVCSSAAGVEHILCDPHYPAHVPLVRMQTGDQAQRMSEYVCLGALSLLRDLPRMVAAKARGAWDHFERPRTACETRVGVMGMGNLGTAAAVMLSKLGFIVAGWSSSPKSIDCVESFAGPGAFDAFLARTDILVNLLPDTASTKGLMDADNIAKLPAGAGIVNAGRGPQIVTADMLAALDSGHLSGAFLDVFDIEPLPSDSPLWAHPKVIISPHNASFAARRPRAEFAAAAIAALAKGETPTDLCDLTRDY